ncbi:protein of unknown function [Burkholderia multivorans]
MYRPTHSMCTSILPSALSQQTKHRFDNLESAQLFQPSDRDAFHPMSDTGKTARHRRSRVGRGI